MQKSKAIFSWSVTGLLTLMIVGAIGALTLKSAPNSTIGVTQTTISAGVAGAAPAPQASSNSSARTASVSGDSTTTTVRTSSGALTTIPAGAVIVPAPTGHEANEANEGNEGREGNEHAATATSTVKSGTSSGGHEKSGERD